MELTDQEIDTLVEEVSREVLGSETPSPEQLMKLLESSVADTIKYPNDPKKQFVLEIIVMGSSMPDAFAHLSDKESPIRCKILLKFLDQIGIFLC
jgi:hypothetical protein